MDKFTELMQTLVVLVLIISASLLIHSCTEMDHEREKMRIERDCLEKTK